VGKAVRGHVGKPEKEPKLSEAEEVRILCEGAFVGLFSCIGVCTQHEHWLKEASEVRPMTGPLARYINGLPKSTKAALMKRLNPALFCVGAATIVGPDLITEIKLRKYEAYIRAQAEGRAEGPRVGQAGGVPAGGGSPIGQGPSASPNAASNGAVSVAPPEELLGVTI
jgi:hypothetical protein